MLLPQSPGIGERDGREEKNATGQSSVVGVFEKKGSIHAG